MNFSFSNFPVTLKAHSQKHTDTVILQLQDTSGYTPPPLPPPSVNSKSRCKTCLNFFFQTWPHALASCEIQTRAYDCHLPFPLFQQQSSSLAIFTSHHLSTFPFSKIQQQKAPFCPQIKHQIFWPMFLQVPNPDCLEHYSNPHSQLWTPLFLQKNS